MIFGFFLFFLSFVNPLNGQKSHVPGLNINKGKNNINRDSVSEFKKSDIVSEQPDTNFTWEKYAAFLKEISDTSKYIVLPINEFRKTFNAGKVVIGLRHDVDNDLDVAYKFSEIESKLGFRSTYFILHTAPYYLANPNNMSNHSDKILPVLKSMQNDRHFEIAWHNDLVTLQAIYNIDPVSFLHKELDWLRKNGIAIYGTSSHGSTYCHTYKYLNFYFFEECTYPVVGQFVNNITIPVGGKTVTIKKGKLSDFNLEYEAYFLNNNKYFSDASFVNRQRWNIGMLDLNQLHPGDRVIILLHPIHWHKASINTNIDSFRIIGQKSSLIDTVKCEINVEMPYGIDTDSLSAVFSLSPGAYAKVLSNLQISGMTINNFSNPVIYTIYAENRDVFKEWTINVKSTLNSRKEKSK